METRCMDPYGTTDSPLQKYFTLGKEVCYFLCGILHEGGSATLPAWTRCIRLDVTE